jgi:hypothetical protein
MIDVAKLLPVAIMLGGVYKGAEKAKPLLEYTRTIGVQREVNAIAQMIQLDSLDNPLPTVEGFAEYVKRNFHVEGGLSRDVSKDMWGTSYALLVGANGEFTVRSAGPDKKFGDSDDVVALGHAQN